MKVNEGFDPLARLSRGVKQGSCLSPILFIFYIEDMLSYVLEGK